MENYKIRDDHGERHTEPRNQEMIAREVREDDAAHLVMMHDMVREMTLQKVVVAKAVVGSTMARITKK